MLLEFRLRYPAFTQERQRQFEKLTNVDSDRMILRYVFDDRISITVLPTSQDRDFQFVFSLRKLFRFNRLGLKLCLLVNLSSKCSLCIDNIEALSARFSRLQIVINCLATRALKLIDYHRCSFTYLHNEPQCNALLSSHSTNRIRLPSHCGHSSLSLPLKHHLQSSLC